MNTLKWLKTKETVVNILTLLPPLHIHTLTQKLSENSISKKYILPKASQTFNEWKLIIGKIPAPSPLLLTAVCEKLKHWKNSCWDIPLPLNVFPRVEGGGGDVGYLSRSFNNSNRFLLDFTRVFKRGRREGRGGHSTPFTRGDPLPPNYTEFEHFGSTNHLRHTW